MKIEFNDKGVIASATITSTVLNSVFITAPLIRHYSLPLQFALNVKRFLYFKNGYYR